MAFLTPLLQETRVLACPVCFNSNQHEGDGQYSQKDQDAGQGTERGAGMPRDHRTLHTKENKDQKEGS